MSQNHSSSYTTSTATSYSSSTNPQGITKSYSEQIHSNSRDGTTVNRTSAETGQPTRTETTSYPASGGGGGGGRGGGSTAQIKGGRVEEPSENEAKYLEAMEDEYAKREGGA